MFKAKRSIAYLLAIVFTFSFFAGCASNEPTGTVSSEIIKNATTILGYDEDEEDENTAADFKITAGTVTYSHGCILEASRYPGWSAVQIAASGEEMKMTQISNRLYVSGDNTKKAYFGSDSSANPSSEYDLAYVFTSPCKVKADIVLNIKVAKDDGDGVVGYAYRNDTSNCIINGTIVKNSAALKANEVILEKGDKLYFRYNKNKTAAGDEGNFYAKMTFTEVEPEGEPTKGEKFEIKEQPEKPITAGTNTFSHGSIKDPDVYPNWSAVSIELSSGKEAAMVKEGNRLYIAGDKEKKAYFGSEPSANPSEKCDLAYVYTMPCRAKITVAVTAQVKGSSGDGIIGYCYVGSPENMLVDKTVFAAGDKSKAVTKANVIVEKGDKIYFRYNKNKTAAGDEGSFYGKITFVELDPQGTGGTEEPEQPEKPVAAFSELSSNFYSAFKQCCPELKKTRF